MKGKNGRTSAQGESHLEFCWHLHLCLPDAELIDSTEQREKERWEDVMDQFVARWEGLEDPRTGNAGLHDFHELLMIALCTVLCGGQSAVDTGLFAKAEEPFLRGFLALEHGSPSHDTFGRLFRLIDPKQFQAAFQRFMAGVFQALSGRGGDRG
jgi:hypothetical protein